MNRRKLTILGSAAAAAIALSVVFLTPAAQTPVQAKTILNNLQQSLLDGFRLTFTDVGDDGVLLNGVVIAEFAPAAPGTPPDEREAETLYMEVSLQADDTAAPDVAGLDAFIVGANAPDAQWIFGRLNNLPATLQSQSQAAAAFADLFSGAGAVIDLHALDQSLGGNADGLLNTRIQVTGGPNEEMAPELGTDAHFESDTQDGTTTLSGSFYFGFDEAQATGDGDVGLFGGNLTGEGGAFVSEFVEDLIAGRATAEQLAEAADQLLGAAEAATVTEVEPGAYLLEAVNFSAAASGEDVSPETLAALEQMALAVFYREGAGVEWATLSNVGTYGGELRFEMRDHVVIDPELLSYQRLVDQGAREVNFMTLLPIILQAAGEELGNGQPSSE